MSVFTPAEIEYLMTQRLGRIATVNSKGEPHVVPARFFYNSELDVIDIIGGGMGTSKKFRDVVKMGRAAFVVDDIAGPGKPRGVEIRGRAEALMDGGQALALGADPQFIRLTPNYIATWGVDGDNFSPVGRAVGE